MTVHVVGNLCRDTTLCVARFPEPGETLTATTSRCGLGGKGLNQAVAAARTGAEVVLHAAVGREDSAAIERELAAETGLTPRLAVLPLPTDGSTILLRPDGENVVVSASACARAFDPMRDGGRFDALARGDMVVMQGNLDAARTRACLAEARRHGAFTVLNPSPLWDEPDPIAWADVDLLVVNDGECRSLGGAARADQAAAALLAAGAGAVAVTLGRRGALYLDRAASFLIPAPAVAATDTTGAGDVFSGVLAARIQAGQAREPALAAAVAAASLSVTRRGALASCPSRDELAAPRPAEARRSA